MIVKTLNVFFLNVWFCFTLKLHAYGYECLNTAYLILYSETGTLMWFIKFDAFDLILDF